jgi:tetratricopeptide (TPR) repeat protein
LNDHAWSLARSAPDSAHYYAQQAIQRSQAIGNYGKGLINANTLLGILNKDRGYYELSVEHYLEAMQMAEAEGDCLRVSGCLNNLGVVAQVQGNHARALVYFQRSLEIENEHGTDKEQRSIRLYNIGEAFEKLDSLDAAYAFYYNSLLIEEELENKEGIFYARLGIGKVDSKTGNAKKAGTELNKALALAEELKDDQGICEVHNALGNLYIKESQFPAAKTSFEIALEKARAIQYPKLGCIGCLIR